MWPDGSAPATDSADWAAKCGMLSAAFLRDKICGHAVIREIPPTARVCGYNYLHCLLPLLILRTWAYTENRTMLDYGCTAPQYIFLFAGYLISC